MAQDKDNKILNVPTLRFPEFSGEWLECTLGDVAQYKKDRVQTCRVNAMTYVSTENLLSDFGGIEMARSIPETGQVVAYEVENILISNIRPYLKKIWYADRSGGCSTDVLVLESDKCNSLYLYYVIASDRFVNHVMNGAKGVKMPRGDKSQIMAFKFSFPSPNEQMKIAHLLSLLDKRINTQNKIIEKLQSLIKGIIDVAFKTNRRIPLGNVVKKITAGKDKVAVGAYPLYGSTGIIGTTSKASYSGPMVLVARVGSIGKVQYVNEPCGVSDNTLIISAGNYSLFLFYFLCGYNFERITSGTTQPLITATSLKKVEMPIVDYKYSKLVVRLLDAVQRKKDISLKLSQLLQEQKTYLLSQMFI